MAPSTPSAGSRVAHIFELLEQILLEVIEEYDSDNYRTIILSQRVHSTFTNTIQGSKPLQQALSLAIPDLCMIPGLSVRPDVELNMVILQRRHHQAISKEPQALWRRLSCGGRFKEVRTFSGWCPRRGWSGVIIDGLDLTEPSIGEVYDMLVIRIHWYMEPPVACECLEASDVSRVCVNGERTERAFDPIWEFKTGNGWDQERWM